MTGAVPESRAASSDPPPCEIAGATPAIDEAIGEARHPDTIGELGGCPLGILRGTLHMLPLYDRCCFGGASPKMQAAVLRIQVGIPVTLASLKADPDALLTPLCRCILSVLLEFHLPAACPHRTVLHQSNGGSVLFMCCSCCGALRFQEEGLLPPLLCAAFSTALEEDQVLRRRCLDFISEKLVFNIGGTKPR